jgi:hypothetical protein
MNALTTSHTADAIALALPDDLPFTEWMDVGKGLFDQRRKADWMLADWWRHGQSNFRDDPQFALMLEQTAADPKRLSAMAKVAEAFPPHMRAGSLSFEVHREIASVTTPDDRLAMIHRADTERWTERTAHREVVSYRYEQGSLLPDDDPENREAVEIIRAWNRASKSARQYAYELMPRGFGVINEGEANA